MISGGTSGAVIMTYIAMFLTYSAWTDWDYVRGYWDDKIADTISQIPLTPCEEKFVNCWASCIVKHRLDKLFNLPALGSALPKKLVPPFRVVNSKQRLTTLLSVLSHFIRDKFVAEAIRYNGRLISKVATPLTIAEGLYDIEVISYCASDCEANTCSE